MNIFLKADIRDIAQKEHAYFSQKHHADVAVTQAKRQCKLMMGKPETLLGIASLGAYKGAADAKPKAKRNQALMTLGRTALLSLFQ
ncbi:hypothetical protein KL866_16835 [Alteromonas sp. ALT199]|uniref:hypothetical protein n=1 Tax=unclassified Alteromonas TaxID=2614992 RepID=UPI001BE827E5|nr:hypothetical protein [Alteromonas sp. ALT199]MBT3136732.1 hypothetical protein [Alteromonas sp. ALT199]